MKSTVARARAVALLALALMAGCVNQPTEHRVKANAYFRGGQYAEALKECDLGLSGKPDDVGTLILRAKSLFELANSVAESGRGEAEPLSGASEAAILRHCEEGCQFGKLSPTQDCCAMLNYLCGL